MSTQGSRRPRLLLVTALFAPSKQIGARRADRIAARLHALGWDVTVLTLRPEDMAPVDPAIRPPEGVEIIRTGVLRPGDVLRRWASLAAPIARRARGGTRTGSPSGASPADAASPRGSSSGALSGAPAHRSGVLSGLVRGYSRWLARREFPDPIRLWPLTARPALRGRRFDVVFATLPPYTPALVAARHARETGAKLVLDYRDPWTEAPRVDWGAGWHEALRVRHRRMEDACLGEADLLIGVSPTICRLLAARTDVPVELVTNSYEPVAPEPTAGSATGPTSPAADEPARLVYAGLLAHGRTLDPVLAAIASLAKDGLAGRVRLDFAGTSGPQVLASAERLGVASHVRDLGSLPAAQARTLLDGALAGIVLVSSEYGYSLPGKLFDVVASGRPVLLIGPAEGDAAELVRRHHLGWAHEAEDVVGIARSIQEALEGSAPRPEGLEELQTGPVMARLDRALRNVIGGEY